MSDRAGMAVARGAARLSAFRAQVNGGSSRNVEEARARVVELYRRIACCVPFFIFRYNLEGLITNGELRANVLKQFRKHSDLSNPKVVDMLVFKGTEELLAYLDQSMQRHHILSKYVIGFEGMVQPKKLGIVDHGESDFLKKFLQGSSF